jgi:hypothetical protein
MIEYLKTEEIKDVYKNLILPILNGETLGLYPTDNAMQKWAKLISNIEVYNNSVKGYKLEEGKQALQRVESVIKELIDINSIKV